MASFQLGPGQYLFHVVSKAVMGADALEDLDLLVRFGAHAFFNKP